MGDWQPIETAPKDGTSILVGGGTVEWDNSMCGPVPFDGVDIAQWDRNGWQGPNCGGHDEFARHSPTHWMPLPDPPKRT